MLQKREQTKSILLRMPLNLYKLVEKSAFEHHRSKTQELIVAIQNGLTSSIEPIVEPKRLSFGKKITKKALLDAINDGRE